MEEKKFENNDKFQPQRILWRVNNEPSDFFNNIIIILVILFILLIYLIIRFIKGKRKVQEQWQQSNVQKISDFGATKSLEILPLIDWHTNSNDLKVETGISYLVMTDNRSILFDTGLNFEQSDPSFTFVA